MANKIIYLDHAAATPLDPAVQAAMETYFATAFYNPSATYLAAQAVRKDIQSARESVAKWLGARPPEIIFTAGGTEANNLAIHGIMRQYPDTSIIISAIEHDSVIKPAQLYTNRVTNMRPDGRVDLVNLEKLIDDKIVLISIIYANNEIGTIQPLSKVSQLVQAVRKDRQNRKVVLPLFLHTDACQAGAYLDLRTHRLGVDLMTVNGGKIYGPKQSGALYVKNRVILKPLISGGGQERGLRSGTENVANIMGLAKALDLVQSWRSEEVKRLQGLQKLFIDEVKKNIPSAIINGSLSHRLPNNIHLTIPGQDNERLMMELDEEGIQCAVGSACSASSDEPSHVLKAIGLNNVEARSSLRFSMGRSTTTADLKKTVSTLRALVR